MISGERAFRPDRFQDIDQVVEACWRLVEPELLRQGYGEVLPKIRMVLGEAIINAWKHGNRRQPDLPILFRWRLANDFCFEVIDAGAGFNFRALPDPTRDEGLIAETGRGLFIIKSFASSVGWQKRGRHLIVTFARPHRSGHAP
ncbi:ATP-binding protein [Desulfurivibrio sp. D14AmB]|uniref:ATP-binding protein n=1 Tax=Desulfurivibrio sp. D14AmB TaxID=3374370 RepID=UPI00376ECBE9